MIVTMTILPGGPGRAAGADRALPVALPSPLTPRYPANPIHLTMETLGNQPIINLTNYQFNQITDFNTPLAPIFKFPALFPGFSD